MPVPAARHARRAPAAKRPAEEILPRLWRLLRFLSHQGAPVTVARIAEGLDYPNKKKVERDLAKFEQVFPDALICDADGRAYTYAVNRDAGLFRLAVMTEPEALALKLVERALGGVLPRSVAGALAPHFAEAARTLTRADGTTRRRWAEKVHFETPTQPLAPPPIDPAVQGEVFEALLQDHQLEIVYGDGTRGPKKVNPLGLVQRGATAYLVCTFAPRRSLDDLRYLPLHRFRRATHVRVPVDVPDGFSLADAVRSGHLGFGRGETIMLEATFHGDAAARITETPLSVGQETVRGPDDAVTVRARVHDTPQLEWWLLGFAELVEVHAPPPLRERVNRRLRAAAARYAKRHGTPAERQAETIP